MTDNLVTRLRNWTGDGWIGDDYAVSDEAADRIEELQDIIARIQYTNLRRDMNIENRTKEIDRLCKGET